jgi:uncharacterized protein YbaR (Trm112 family)
MDNRPRLSSDIQKLLRCPVCRGQLNSVGEELICQKAGCGRHFPIIDGIPVLINNASSIFSIENLILYKNPTFDLGRNKIKDTLRRVTPSISRNIKAKQNYGKLANILLSRSKNPRVLVLGGGIIGQGFDTFLGFPQIEVVESDISFGPRTALICDAHDIPFEEGIFDGIIVQAVLEHVISPYKCVDEIYRVLKSQGLVYAETPFIQQVHGREYDFTRFTFLGHRRLFNHFDELESGAVCGPGMALAWSYQYFLLSLTSSRFWRRLFTLFSSLTSFWLKYLDYYLINKPGTMDAASAFFFLGQKSEKKISDKELIALYKGAF